MVGITVGMIVIASAVSFYMTSLNNSSRTLSHARLNEDLNTVMQLMVNEIRRAGYGLSLGTTPVHISENCLLYSYLDDTIGGTQQISYRGFRVHQGEVKIKSLPSNSAIGCDQVTRSLTDHTIINISELMVSDNTSRCSGTPDGQCEQVMSGETVVKTLLLKIRLTASLSGEASANKTLLQSVRLKNNMTYTAP